jgi:hypothetical protein
MSVLLIDVVGPGVLSDVQTSGVFEKCLLVVPEEAVLSADLRREFVPITDCLQFIRGSSKKFVLRTSSELFRGIVAGTLYANYILSVSSDRPDLFKKMLPLVKIYDPTSASEHQDTSTTQPVQPSGEVSGAVFNQLANLYLTKVLAVPVLRQFTVPTVMLQLLAVVRGDYSKVIPYVQDKEHTARLLFEAAVKEGYFKKNGDNIVYNHQLCMANSTFFSQPAASTKPQPTISTDASSCGSFGAISPDNALYLKACNIFVNSYLSSAKLRGYTPSAFASNVREVLVKLKAPAECIAELPQIIYEGFKEFNYFTVKGGQLIYNEPKCKNHSIKSHNVPIPKRCCMNKPGQTPHNPPVTTPIKPEEPPPSADKPSELQAHIATIICKVQSGRSLESMDQIMIAVQESLLEYEKEIRRMFDVEDVLKIVETVREYLAESGYCSNDYPR